MDYIGGIRAYVPQSEQEAAEQRAMLAYMERYPDTVLLRENLIAHITSSGLILNRELTRVLLVHHNIRGLWAWTGGHADGDGDLLRVAVREAQEETGATAIRPLSDRIASLDILPVFGHMRKGRCVSAHLHLNVAYLLLCGEAEPLRPKPGETTGAAWFDTGYVTRDHFDSFDTALYGKLIGRARGL